MNIKRYHRPIYHLSSLKASYVEEATTQSIRNPYCWMSTPNVSSLCTTWCALLGAPWISLYFGFIRNMKPGELTIVLDFVTFLKRICFKSIHKQCHWTVPVGHLAPFSFNRFLIGRFSRSFFWITGFDSQAMRLPLLAIRKEFLAVFFGNL